MEEIKTFELNDVKCEICNERVFQEREGFYYCVECGTKKDHLLAVEINAEDTNNDPSKHFTQRIVNKPTESKTEDKNEITSWEFYNYVLRGFVDELLNMGAKQDLKLMALQVWASYLSRMEVAFCNTNELGLPKLNVRVLPRDLRIVYNHKRIKRIRKRHINKTSDADDVRAKGREWRKSKRKLDQSVLTNTADPESLITTQSINLQWSWKARKTFKKMMPLKHLDKHSEDSMGMLSCHRRRPKASELGRFDRNIYCLNISKLYVILAIALNMIGDDIQLTDLVRFIDEERLSSRFVLRYLPENVAKQGKNLLDSLEYLQFSEKCTNNFIRIHISQMACFIGLNHYKTPDLTALTDRYVRELGLPPLLGNYVCALINLLPPDFHQPFSPTTYPHYEARVMAYIIYVMKLLFGLDDVKEREISASAQDVNAQLVQINKESENDTSQPLLFVFTEWMEYVEMRKILIAQHDEHFAIRFGINTSIERKVDNIITKDRSEDRVEYSDDYSLITPEMRRKQENFRHLVETLLKEHFGESSTTSAFKNHIDFQATLTPAHTYFNHLLLHAEEMSPGEMSVKIPEFMYTKHSERNIAPFKNQTADLAKYFLKHNSMLKIVEVACQENRKNVGIFQLMHKSKNKDREFRANFNAESESWIREMKSKEKRPMLKFRQPLAKYTKAYKLKLMQQSQRRNAMEAFNPFWDLQPTPSYILDMGDEQFLLNELSSLQIFSESDMDPLNVSLKLPNRNLGISNLKMENVSETQTKTEETSGIDINLPPQNEVTLKISNFDCWLLHGYSHKIRSPDKRQLRTLFPHSFRWLLETCSATIGVDWGHVYEQLLTLEVIFHYGIEDLSNFRNQFRFKYNNINKDINLLTKRFREFW